MNLENLVGQIPKLNEGIEGIMKTLGTLLKLTKNCQPQVQLFLIFKVNPEFSIMECYDTHLAGSWEFF